MASLHPVHGLTPATAGAAGLVLPGCQDTGTGIVIGKRGQYVLTDGKDEEHISRGVYNTYTQHNLR
jgi:fumarate hydratase, class I